MVLIRSRPWPLLRRDRPSPSRKDRRFAEGLANGLIRHDREIARARAELALTIQSAYRLGIGRRNLPLQANFADAVFVSTFAATGVGG